MSARSECNAHRIELNGKMETCRRRRRRRARTMRVHIKPRLQQEKWSLYWKTSMSTRTFALDEFDLEVKHDETTAKEVRTRKNFEMRHSMTFHARR